MATASRSRQPAGAKRRTPNVAAALAFDSARPLIVPVATVVVMLVAAGLGMSGTVAMAPALATTIVAILVLLAYIGERPLLGDEVSGQARGVGLAVAVAWLLTCYAPFHLRLFPGTPLVTGAELSHTGSGLPLRIPAAGHRAIDLLLEGKLVPAPGAGAAIPVQFALTVDDASGTSRVVDGRFEDTLGTRRLGRRGTAVVHQLHSAELRVLTNPAGGDLTVSRLTLEPETAPPITVTAYPHPLPGPIVLALAGLLLVAAVIAFDRLGPLPEDTDGALTLATAAVMGAAIVFWTGNAVHPDFQTLIGSAIFGGPLGFAAGALVWWIAKRVVVRPAH